MSDYPDGWDPGFHPRWCDPAACTAPPARETLGTTGGAHRSAVVSLNLEAAARGETGQVTGQLQQSVRPDAKPFLVWLIGGVHVGHIRLEDAAPIALLIADGLGLLEDAEPDGAWLSPAPGPGVEDDRHERQPGS